MTEEMRINLTPQGYIRMMFEETKDGKFNLTDCSIFKNQESITFELNWTKDDAEMIERKYSLLTAALNRIGCLHDQLEDKENREKLLSESDLDVWNTYVCPFEPFEDDDIIDEIYDRVISGEVSEDEKTIWKRYCIWREEQSQKRIPFNRRSALNMIIRAARYERLISIHAPDVVVIEEGRCLAEEMILYYFGKEEPLVLN